MSKINKDKRVVARRNAGLGDNLLATAHAWYYASQTGRDLEICWAPSMYFSDKSINSFGKFFRVPQSIEGVTILYEENIGLWKRLRRRLPLSPVRFFIPTMLGEGFQKIFREKTPAFIERNKEKRRNWLAAIIESGTSVRNKEVVVNTHFNFLEPRKIKPFFDALQLAPKYQERLNDFKEKHFKNKTVIGAHIRYYDMSLPFSNHTPFWLDPEKSFSRIKNELQKITQRLNTDDYVFFLATDNVKVYDSLHGKIDNLVTYPKEFQNIKFTLDLHHKVKENSFEDDLIEMFLLAESQILYRFPPSGSWFSYYASLYAQEEVI